MEHYNKRSNVETSFMALKRKFGDTLKAKNPVSQANELLCKVVAYNVVTLVHEYHELGLEFSLKSENPKQKPY